MIKNIKLSILLFLSLTLTACGSSSGGGATTTPPTTTDTSGIITLESVSENAASLTWPSASTAGAKYHIYKSTSTIGSISDITAETRLDNSSTISATNFKNEGLNAGTDYYYKVFATDSSITDHTGLSGLAENSPLLLKVYTTLKVLTKPAQATGLTFSGAKQTELGYKWDDITGASGYKLYYHTATFTATTDTDVKAFNATSSPATITGLTAGTKYFVRILAFNASGDGKLSADEVEGYTSLAPVTNLSATANSTDQITLNWTAVTGATGYKIYRYNNADLSDSPVVNSVANVFTYADTGLEAGTTYYYKVTAKNASAESALSEATSVSVLTFPDKPTGLTLIKATTTTLTYKWDDITGASGYKLYYHTATFTATTDTDVKAFNATTSPATITGLTAGTKYFVRVEAVSTQGNSELSDEVEGYTSITAEVTGVSATANSTSQITVTWDALALTGMQNYKVYRYEQADFSDSPTLNPSPIGDTTTTYTDTGLEAGTMYYYKVTAKNASAESALSEATSVSVLTFPDKPTGLTLIKATTTTLTFKWDSMKGADNYYLTYDTPGALILVTTKISAPATGVTITGLMAGTLYVVGVQAENKTGKGKISETFDGYTSITAEVTGVSATANSTSQITVTWDALTLTGMQNYKVYRYEQADFSDSPTLNPSPIGDTTTTYTDTGLEAGTMYYYKVTATTANSETDLSTAESDSAMTKLAKTTNLTFVEATKTTLTYKWDKMTGATDYKVYHHTSIFVATTDTGLTEINTTSTATGITITGLATGTEYFVGVLAVNTSGNGTLSTVQSIYTLLSPSRTISAVALSPSSVYISWVAAAKATSYKLCFDIGITPVIGKCTITDISTNFYTHNTGLTANTVYYYKVIAVNEGRDSELSTAEATATTFLSGETVADFAHDITQIEKEAVNLTWTGYANATAYNLYYEVQPITSTTAVADALSTKVTLGNVTNYKLTDLASNAVYGLKIQAVTNSGITDLGDGIIAAPLATTLALGKNTVAGSSTVSVVHPGINIEVHRSETANCDLTNTSSCDSYYATTITTQGTGFIDNHTTTNAYYKLKTAQGMSTNSVQIDTAATRFSARYYHQAVVFKNEFYLIGGYDNITLKSDVWKSADGVNWIEVTANVAFLARATHQVIVWNNEFYLIGGGGSSGYKNDVWKSSDGVTWTEVTANANFSARAFHQVVVWNNELYLIGGIDVNDNIKNDVWKSADGVNWTEVTANANFSARAGHQVVVWNNEFYLIGGDINDDNYKNDVWQTSDGANWTQVVTTGPIFSARENHQVVVWNDELYLLGGYDNNDKNDVWKSADGVNWTEVTANAAFSHRENHQVIVWNNELYLLGGSGFNNDITNDVWKSSDGALWFEMFSSQPITW